MKRAYRISLALVAALAMTAFSASARAEVERDVERARAHFEAGEAHFDAGRYREAMAEFSRADALVASPINRYNIALCQDSLGDAAAAVREYRAYLEAMPDAPNRGDVEARIAELREELASGAEVAPRERDVPAPDRDPATTEDRTRPDGVPKGDGDGENDDSPYESPPPGGWGAPGTPDYPGEPLGEAPADSGERDRSEAKPIYKSWWFWGVAGVSALILINIATASSSDGAASLELFEPSPSAGGVTIWQF